MYASTLASIWALPPALWCQAFFLGAVGAIVALHSLPLHLRRTLVDYGARRHGAGAAADSRGGGHGRLSALLARLIGYGHVPHSWFWHFYFLSVSWSAFWAWQYLLRGSVMAALAQAQARSASPSTELGRVFLAWSMLAAQGARRLYECFFVAKPGRTPMLLVHWAMGMAYYTAMNLSVWIEGSGAILESWKSPQPVVLLTTRVPTALAIFMAAWLKQNECHRYLASLNKYTLPSEGLFKYLVCPHYTCECVIYLAVAFVAAPPDSLFNATVLCGLAFVAVNLGATAHSTKQWYAQKLGPDQVAARWKMIPLVF